MIRHRINKRAIAAQAAKPCAAIGHQLGHRGEITAWLSAGALTLGVGAALTAPAVADAATGHHSGSVTASGSTARPKAGPTGHSTHPLKVPEPALHRLSTAKAPAAQPAGPTDKRVTAVVQTATNPAPRPAASVPTAEAIPPSPATVVKAAGTSAVSTPTAPVSPWQPLVNVIVKALVTLTGMNPTSPTPANPLQLLAYSAARWLEDTTNPGGVPHASTTTVGTLDPATGVVNGHVVFTDTAGAPLTYKVSLAPGQGTVTLNSDGVFTYTPSDAARLQALGGSVVTDIRIVAINGVQSSSIVFHVPVLSPGLGSVAIPVGKGPLDLALTPNGKELVVTNSADNTVSIVDTATNTVTATINVGTSPLGVAITPDGTRAYIANLGDGNFDDFKASVSVVSLTTGTVIATVPMNYYPAQWVTVTPDGKYVWVGFAPNPDNTATGIIATATNSQYEEGPLSQPNSNPGMMAVSPTGCGNSGCIYIPVTTHGWVELVSLGTLDTYATIKVGEDPTGAAINPTDTRLYVSNYADNTVSVIDTATKAVIATVPVGKGPTAVAVSPDGSVAYVVDSSASTITAIRTSTNKVIATIPTGTQDTSGLTISPDGTTLYVTDDIDNTVSAITI